MSASIRHAPPPPRRHVFLILNGKAAAEASLREAVGRLRDAGHRLDVRVTWEGGDAARLVAEALAQGSVDTVVAAGGDGTLNEVASALADAGDDASALPVLGLVPLGTANDFARGAGIDGEAEDVLEAVLAMPVQAIDLLRVQAEGRCRWCVNLASGGIGTEVTLETPPGLKKRLGGLAYALTGLGHIGQSEPLPLSLRGDGFAWDGDCVVLAVGNGRHAGGGHVLCHRARIDDGLLDVTVLPSASEGTDWLALFGTALAEGGETALADAAVQARLPWLEVRGETSLGLNLDGEPMQGRYFRIDCVPGRLRMHLPAGSPLLGGRGDQAPSR